jgi:CheY-like chemotaxis protein
VNILLVDDNPMDIFVIRDLFANSGMDLQIRAETNGPDTLTYLSDLEKSGEEKGPALVIMDLNLPKLSGFEVLRRIRNMEKWSKMPVIIVTSSLSDHDRDMAGQLGATAYFRKPMDLDTYAKLMVLVREALHAREAGTS